MRTLWKIAEGGYLFASQREAERAANGISSEWGRAYGGPNRTVATVKVFESAEEWVTYTGMGHQWEAT